MAKRFTDTDIWDQDWFIDLPNKYKLLWNYIKDKCDNVGIWRPNKSVLQKIIGEPLGLDEFLQFVNIEKERLKVLPSGRWWLKDFFIFQYGDKFSPTSQVHKGALKTLVQNGIHLNEIFKNGIGELQHITFQQLKEIAYAKDIDTLNITYGNPSLRVKDKDKVIDKDKKKGGAGENKEKGIRFDEEFTVVFFEDESFQKLGVEQKILAENKDITAATIIKGHIY